MSDKRKAKIETLTNEDGSMAVYPRTTVSALVDDKGKKVNLVYRDENGNFPQEMLSGGVALIPVTLKADSWTNNSQTISVDRILGDEKKQIIQPIPAADTKELYDEFNIQLTGEAEGSLTFSCDDIPTEDIQVYITIQMIGNGCPGDMLASVYDPQGKQVDIFEYVDNAIGNIPTPDVSGQINTHNIDTDAHSDIRLLIEGLVTRLNTLANSDDITLDQMAEVVAYVKNNKSLIDAITTNKVNTTDIINNLTTNVSNKPLSAAQGVVLKALIDAIKIPTKVSELTNDKNYLTSFTETDPTVPAWAKQPNKPVYTASEVGAMSNNSALVDDCNLVFHQGPYKCSANTLNGPPSITPSNGDILFVLHWDINTVFQLYIPHSMRGVYFRSSGIGQSSKEWFDWKKFASTDYALPRDGSATMTNRLFVKDWVGLDGNEAGAFIFARKEKNSEYPNRILFLASENYTPHTKDAVILRDTRAEGNYTDYNILHTSNKPSGSYTGNGDATERTIDVGGIGNVLAIWSHHASCYVTAAGVIFLYNDQIFGFGSSKVKFVDGYLTIAESHDALNQLGTVYGYQVL